MTPLSADSSSAPLPIPAFKLPYEKPVATIREDNQQLRNGTELSNAAP